ncbi:MAG: tRNA (N6-isopentenyl adenosine(37)-C2)-methylthiotransferase MiaB [Chitinophagaceae bacterium]|nr:tRNA (N6-isopentenyl adenosine(37)-C2)-methylthiotransferase MiaB [Chitinophagaceae bacterium]
MPVTLDVAAEIHDENRQGEALAVKHPASVSSIRRSFYIESYGCAMNFSDSEIIASILMKDGFAVTENFMEADLVLINTCSIRENAEQRVRQRLTEFKKAKQNNPDTLIGVLGCMAERLKSKFLEEEKIVDIVIGPDAYRDLPLLVAKAEDGHKGVNVLLSREETYADINPVRLNSNGITAFISIMRGCNNMCSFCVVPFTRGRERSRDPQSIIDEATALFVQGYREVTLLGQNVDSYFWKNPASGDTLNFAQLLEQVAKVHPLLRVRFSTSHPKDITDEVVHTMSAYHNICKHIHLPVQSGSSEVLKRMNRTYDRDWYLERINTIRSILPGCGISTDIITGFCGETEKDHAETLSMMEYVKYNLAYMFSYSERPGTPAEKNFTDDVSAETKSRRLSEIVALQHQHQQQIHAGEVGNEYEVLAEGISKRSKDQLFGRTTHNKVIIFPKNNICIGDYVTVRVDAFTSATLMGEVVSSE